MSTNGSTEEGTTYTMTGPSLKEEQDCYVVPVDAQDRETPFSKSLFAKGDRDLDNARKAYLKILLPGVFLVSLTILAVFSIYWGSLWTAPAHDFPGWIVDFDGGDVGSFVIQNLRATSQSPISWSVVPSNQFPSGFDDVTAAVKDNRAWIAVVINEGATSRLRASISNPNTSYNGAEAMTIFGNEARSENAYRNLLKPSIETSATAISLAFRTELAANLSSSTNMSSILATSPQTVVNPLSFTVLDLVPFAQPVASAALTTGLIFLLIMAYFVVMISGSAREASGLNKLLQLKSIIALRLGSSFVAYFLLSLMYTFVNLGFKLNLGHEFGHAGFVLFWIASWIYMLAVGLALESLTTLLKHFVPFFLITWIAVNVSTNTYPLEVLPKFYRYGYAAPFYNFSKAIRTIVFGTKNTLGLNFGVLLVWVVLSCATLCLFQWNARREAVSAMRKTKQAGAEKQGV